MKGYLNKNLSMLARIREASLGLSLFLAVVIVVAATFVSADNTSTDLTVGNAAPAISGLSLNGGNAITLVENNFVWATSSMTITDNNGCSGINYVEATIYRASTSNSGTTCSADDNNCYVGSCVATTTGNTCSGGADVSVEYDCGYKLWYIADPTNAGSQFALDIWSASATTSDGFATTTATNTAETIEVNKLLSINVDASLSYGSVSPGSDTGALNSTTTITNTGNAPQDTQIGGDWMCTDYPTCAGGVILHTQQEYSLAPFTYGGGTTLAATSSPATVETVLVKPTATSTPVTDDVSWGIAVPSGQTQGSYTGANEFTAVDD